MFAGRLFYMPQAQEVWAKKMELEVLTDFYNREIILI